LIQHDALFIVASAVMLPKKVSLMMLIRAMRYANHSYFCWFVAQHDGLKNNTVPLGKLVCFISIHLASQRPFVVQDLGTKKLRPFLRTVFLL
jgi:hypothetical protein